MDFALINLTFLMQKLDFVNVKSLINSTGQNYGKRFEKVYFEDLMAHNTTSHYINIIYLHIS